MATSTQHVMRNALGLFVGVTVPLVGYFAYTANTNAESSNRGFIADMRDQGPGELVAGAMPQVAVMGHRDGPAGTREVMIQVPGVPGPQSVFVLPDGETMIAGRVVDSRLSAYSIVPEVLAAENKDNTPGEALEKALPARSALSSSEAAISPEATEPLAEPAASKTPLTASIPVPEVLPSAGSMAAPSEPFVVPPSDGSSHEQVGANAADVQQSPAPTSEQVVGVTEVTEVTETPQVGGDEGGQPKVSDEGSQVASVTPTLEDKRDLTTHRDFQAEMQRIVREDEVLLSIKNQSDFAAQQRAYYSAVQNLPSISQGDGDKDLYVFFDPNCPICHSLYKELAADVAAGNLVVHWVPSVVFSNRPSSIISSAKLIEGIQGGVENMDRELGRVMTRDGYTDELSAGYTETNNAILQSVVFNTAMMAVARPETPLLVFLGPDGALNIERGIPAPGLLNRIQKRES